METSERFNQVLTPESDLSSVLYTQVKSPSRLNSIAALTNAKTFVGRFELGSARYQFRFTPKSSTIENRQFALRGTLSITPDNHSVPAAGEVTAILIGAQGGVGVAPTRRQLGGAPNNVNQLTDEDNGPATELQPGLHAFESPRTDKDGRPLVESSGELAFAGALFFRLSSFLNAGGSAHDTSRVQLNLRLSPNDELGREFLFLLTDVVEAVLGAEFDEAKARKTSEALNRFLIA